MAPITLVQEVAEAPPAEATATEAAEAQAGTGTVPAGSEDAGAAVPAAAGFARPPARMSERGNDLTTISGWLAEYDYWAKAMKHKHAWCELLYAYMNSNHNYGNKIPYPDDANRAKSEFETPWEHLNDDGKKHRLQQEQDILVRYEESLMAAIEYGCANESYLTFREANQILTAFLLPEIRTRTAYSNWFQSTISFTTDGRLPQQTTDEKDELERKIMGAVEEILTGFFGEKAAVHVVGRRRGTEFRHEFGRIQVTEIIRTVPPVQATAGS